MLKGGTTRRRGSSAAGSPMTTPARSAREAVGLGERPADEEVRQRRNLRVADERRPGEVGVGLVDEHAHVRRALGDAHDVGPGNRSPVGLFGLVRYSEPRLRPVSGEHAFERESEIRPERDFDDAGADRRCGRRIHVERGHDDDRFGR